MIPFSIFTDRLKDQREADLSERHEELIEYQRLNRELNKELEVLKQASADYKVMCLSVPQVHYSSVL